MKLDPRRKNILLALCTIIFLAIVHLFAMEYFWYWKFPWLDLLTHFLGGMVLGFAALWIGRGYEVVRGVTLSRRQEFYLILGCALGVGITWEVFEYVNGLFEVQHYVVDTSIDLVMDTLGALFASTTLHWFSRPTTPEIV